jgi:hypothetical protein
MDTCALCGKDLADSPRAIGDLCGVCARDQYDDTCHEVESEEETDG